MQMSFLDLSEEERKRKTQNIKPLKGQLLKWVGNKQKFALEIISFFPDKFGTYYEPFLGSGAILATLAKNGSIGSDTYKPLIDIFSTLQQDPELLTKWYSDRWYAMKNGDKKEIYERIRKSYNTNPNPADLLFISRSCYGGVVRFRIADGHISTPVGIHIPISPESFLTRVNEWYKRVKEVKFLNLDYEEVMYLAKPGDLIYCDPPYSYSQAILYGAQKFNLEHLLDLISMCKERGVNIALSIDGTKRSGNMICDLPLPAGLFEREIFINTGRSMLKRFQMNGMSLESENVSDRLLLTY
jgi:DNA adenine methylase